MCGRYRLSRRKQLIDEYFETNDEVDWEPRYNIAPSQDVVIIRQDRAKPERHFSLARWGLIPYWAKDAGISNKTINARAETVVSKPAFRDAFTSRRCLLPTDGFFEWRRSLTEKQPFHFGMRDDSLFAFAGLWDRWKDPNGAVIESCSILTTTPNSLLADIHDRMPVILRQEDYDLWLDPRVKDVKTLGGLLVSFDHAKMRRFPVSTRINSVTNDDPDCVVPTDSSSPAQVPLFGQDCKSGSDLPRFSRARGFPKLAGVYAARYTLAMNDKAQDVGCLTCGAPPGRPCCRENGSVLFDSHLARKTLASVEIAKAKKKATQIKRHGESEIDISLAGEGESPS